MIYGLVGSSGVGKTTVASMVADALSMTFLKTTITASAAKIGINPIAKLSIQERIKLQWHLLNDHMEMLAKAPRPMITDRTPIDLIGYMLAEVDMWSHENLTRDEMTEVESYVGMCCDLAEANYDYLFSLSRLSNYESADTRPAENPAYQIHCQYLMNGVLQGMTDRLSFSVLRTTDLTARVDYISTMIANRLDLHERKRKKLLLH